VYVTAPLQNLVISTWKCPSSALQETQPTAWVTWWTNYNHEVPGYIGIMGAYPDPAGNTGAIYNSNYGGWWSNSGMLVPNAQTRIADASDGPVEHDLRRRAVGQGSELYLCKWRRAERVLQPVGRG